MSEQSAGKYPPDELLADGAEGGLGEEGGAELVALDHVHLGLLDGAAALVQRKQALSLPLLLALAIHPHSRGVWKDRWMEIKV